MEYWKKLAEERRLALEEALRENEGLWEKVHELEKEKTAMEQIVNEAKAMVEMIQVNFGHCSTSRLYGHGKCRSRIDRNMNLKSFFFLSQEVTNEDES